MKNTLIIQIYVLTVLFACECSSTFQEKVRLQIQVLLVPFGTLGFHCSNCWLQYSYLSRQKL